jgi:hypothetical protein
MKYVIRWKSKVNGRAGKGSKNFDREEAERLVSELNTEYPDIEHEVIEAPPPEAHLEESHSEGPMQPANVVSSE